MYNSELAVDKSARGVSQSVRPFPIRALSRSFAVDPAFRQDFHHLEPLFLRSYAVWRIAFPFAQVNVCSGVYQYGDDIGVTAYKGSAARHGNKAIVQCILFVRSILLPAAA